MRKRKSILMFVLFLVFVSQSSAIYATGEQGIQIEVNQSIVEEDVVREEDQSTFSYQFIALEKDNPMPTESVGSTYCFTMTGTQQIKLGQISYQQEGIFHYEIKQVIEEDDLYQQDDRVFKVTVYITRDHMGKLEAQVVELNDANEKVAVIQFTNVYIKQKESTGETPSIDTRDRTNQSLYIILGSSALVCLVILYRIRRKGIS